MIIRVVISNSARSDVILVEGDDPEEVAKAFLKVEKILQGEKEERE